MLPKFHLRIPIRSVIVVMLHVYHCGLPLVHCFRLTVLNDLHCYVGLPLTTFAFNAYCSCLVIFVIILCYIEVALCKMFD